MNVFKLIIEVLSSVWVLASSIWCGTRVLSPQQQINPSEFSMMPPFKNWEPVFELRDLDQIVTSYDGSRVFAFSSSGIVQKSSDYGTTWNLSDERVGSQYFITGGAACSADCQHVYYIPDPTQNLLRHSSAYGELSTWNDSHFNVSGSFYYQGLACDETGEIVYVGGREGTLFKSNDYGKTWKIITFGDDFAVNIINAIATSRTGQYVYVVAPYGIIRSNDYGESWLMTYPSSNKTTYPYVGIATNGIGDVVMTAVLKSGLLYQSIDYGLTYQKVDIGPGDWVAMTISDRGGTSYVASQISESGSPMMISSDVAVTWAEASNIEPDSWRSVVIAKTFPQLAYGVSQESMQVFRSLYYVPAPPIEEHSKYHDSEKDAK